MGAQYIFGRIGLDPAINETANKDTETRSGAKGYSLKSIAVVRYHIIAHYSRNFLGCLEICFYNRVTQHRDPQSVPIEKDKNDINSLEKKISFLTDDEASISTGVISLADIAEDLLTEPLRCMILKHSPLLIK